MKPIEIVEIAREAFEWFDSAGKDRLLAQYIEIFESDHQDQMVSIFALQGILQMLTQDGMPGKNDFIEPVSLSQTLDEIVDNRPNAVSETFHPELMVSLGTLVAVIASDSHEHFLSSNFPGIRVAAAVMSDDEKILDELSFDQCMVVRSIVASNRSTSSKTKARLEQDAYLNVRQRLDRKFVASDGDNWLAPAACNCLMLPHNYQDINSFFSEKRLFLPNISDTLAPHIRHFGGLDWGTHVYPTPEDDYLLTSQEYLKGKTPDHFSIRHWGQGINSYGLNLRIAIGDIAFLGQVGWGGAYMDSSQDLQSWNEMVDDLDDLLQNRVESSKAESNSRRFLIVYSNFRLEFPELYVLGEDGSWSKKDGIESLADVAQLIRNTP